MPPSQFVFVLNAPIGLGFSTYAFTIRNKSAQVWCHAVNDVVLNLALVGLIVTSYFAILKLRDLQKRLGE